MTGGVRVLEGEEKEDGAEKALQEIKAENPQFGDSHNLQIQEAVRILTRINPKKSRPR